MCSSVVHIIAILCFFTALTINLVAIATPGWLSSTAASVGLFQAISEGNILTVVRAEAENVAFAMSVIADVLLIVAIVTVAVAACVKKEIAKIGGILGIIAALFIVIGMATYTGLRISSVDNTIVFFGYSFAIGWVSGGLALIGGIGALFA